MVHLKKHNEMLKITTAQFSPTSGEFHSVLSSVQYMRKMFNFVLLLY